jgi:hypothetical protein
VNSHDARPAEMVSDALSPAEAVPSEAPPAVPLRAEAGMVRGAPEWRQLSFRTSGLTIELEITGAGEDRRLMGQLIPRQPAVVDVRHPGGVISVEADTLGRFSAEAVPLGQVSLRCRLGPETDQSSVVTGWISI